MLTQDQGQKMAAEQQTIVDNILKEHYQMYLLDMLFKSKIEGKLVFKGGTALRLAYNSTRFSEDLDFSLLGNVSFEIFEKIIKAIPSILAEAKIKDVHEKRNTLFARISFLVNFKPIPIGIKIEINKKVKDFDYAPVLLKSPFNNIETIGRVYTLEAILKDKLRILNKKERRQPRDLFDAWYISQKLDKNFTVKPQYRYNKKELMNRLRPLLPNYQIKIMEAFEK